MDKQILDLRKQIVLNLSKSLGLENQKAQVILCMDRSGSMDDMYRDGTVQSVLERIVPVAMQFDDDQSFELLLFDNHCRSHGTNVTVANCADFVKRELGNYDFGGTEYAPPIKAIVEKYCTKKSGGFLGFGSKQEAVKLSVPVYVIFITDGDNSDKDAARAAIKMAASHGIFFQFVGIGRTNFKFLEELDTMPGRFIDNANFFKLNNVNKTSDDELYKLLLAEFPSWITLAKQKGALV